MHSVLGPRQCVRACECNPQRCYLVTSRRALFTAYMRRDCEPRGTRPPADVLASGRRAGACGVSLSCDARVAPLLVLPPPSFFPVDLTCVPPPSCTEDRERYWTELPSRLRLQAKYSVLNTEESTPSTHTPAVARNSGAGSPLPFHPVPRCGCGGALRAVRDSVRPARPRRIRIRNARTCAPFPLPASRVPIPIPEAAAARYTYTALAITRRAP